MTDTNGVAQQRRARLDGPIPKSWLGRVYAVFHLTYLRWCYAGTPIMAAAIGFYALICFMPLGMFLVWTAGLAVGSERLVLARLRDALAAISPATAGALTKQVGDALSGADPRLTGILGLLALVWAGHRLFEILEASLTRVWHGRPVRTFLARKVLAFVMLTAAAALLGAYMMLVSALATVRAVLVTSDPHLGLVTMKLWQPLTRVLATAVVFLAFFLIYRFLPREKVPARVALLGAAVATALFQGLAGAYGWWIGQTGSYLSVYGAMANVVLFGLWAYLSGAILLVSAALSASYFQVFGPAWTRAQGPPEEAAPAEPVAAVEDGGATPRGGKGETAGGGKA
jgi:membrane protein